MQIVGDTVETDVQTDPIDIRDELSETSYEDQVQNPIEIEEHEETFHETKVQANAPKHITTRGDTELIDSDSEQSRMDMKFGDTGTPALKS